MSHSRLVRIKQLAASLLIGATVAASGMTPGFAIAPAAAFSGGSFKACTEPGVLNYIQRRFTWTDRHVLKRGLAIDAIHRAHENRRRPAAELRPIGRTYCHATAHMNDGRKRQIWYLIENGMGFAGYRDNVEFCIDGLDPWKVHGAWCRSVR
jgi:hypothetical protein